MAGFRRYRDLLCLFTEAASSWTVADMAVALGSPTSSVYRIVRELVATDFLESAAGSHYRLGPAFLEYDRTIRKTDPLIRAGVAVLDRFVAESPIACTALLARRYGNQVMCVAAARSPGFQHSISYQRGRPMPIDRGATSRAILAQLKGAKLDRLLRAAGIQEPERLERLKSTLDAVRRTGHCVTQGEIDRGIIGYAVPLKNKFFGIEASLSGIFGAAEFDDEHEPKVFADLDYATRVIERHMQNAAEALQSADDRLSETG